MRIKEEWACSIIAQALVKIRSKKDVQVVLREVEGTALSVRPDLMKEFRKLVKLKEKTF